MSMEKELKKLLKEQLVREEELYDFCIECLKKLYPDHAQHAVNLFEENICAYEFNGCLMGLHWLDQRLKQDLEHHANYLAKKNAEAQG